MIAALATGAMLAVSAQAQDGTLALGPAPLTAAEPDAATAPAVAPPKPRLVFAIRGGAEMAPAYFGASETVTWHDWHIELDYIRLFGLELGHPTPRREKYGFAIRPSLAVVNARYSESYPQLAGLDIVWPEVEVGLGAMYVQRKYQIHGALRYGVLAHNSWVGELGADYRMYPAKGLEVWMGPRVLFGSDGYAEEYFGVSATEAAAGGLAAYAPQGGLLRAGVEIGANWDIHDKWDFQFAATYDRLLNDAASSPIVLQGSDEQVTARIGFVRRFTIR